MSISGNVVFYCRVFTVPSVVTSPISNRENVIGRTTVEQKAWFDEVIETTIDSAREIVEPHHHMWRSVAGGSLPSFLLEDLWNDTESGHNIKQTVFVECGTEYRTTGPAHLHPVGETEFVTGASQASRGHGHGKAQIAALSMGWINALFLQIQTHEMTTKGYFLEHF
ncbi:MAG: hypothetical protein ACI9OF_000326 [Saprospiraceae bacterium]